MSTAAVAVKVTLAKVKVPEGKSPQAPRGGDRRERLLLLVQPAHPADDPRVLRQAELGSRGGAIRQLAAPGIFQAALKLLGAGGPLRPLHGEEPMEVWVLEATGLRNLQTNGVTEDLVAPGTNISVRGQPPWTQAARTPRTAR